MRLFILKRPPFCDIFFAKRRNKGLAGLHPRNSPQIQLLNLHKKNAQLVGLLTYRVSSYLHRPLPAFSGSLPMTRFRGKEGDFLLTAQRPCRRVPVFHRIPLISRTRMRVHLCIWVAHLPQNKPVLSEPLKERLSLSFPQCHPLGNQWH